MDTILTHNALNRAANLLENMGACETFAGIVEAYPEEVKPAVITTTPAKINGRIGFVISREEIVEILVKLGFGVEEKGEELVVTAPSWRRDIGSVPWHRPEMRIQDVSYTVPPSAASSFVLLLYHAKLLNCGYRIARFLPFGKGEN